MNAPLCGCGCGKPVGIATQTRARWGHVKGEPYTYLRGHAPRPAASWIAERAGPLNPSGLCKCGCGKPAEIAKANRQAFGHVKGEPTLYARGHTRTSGTASPWQFTGERWYVNGRDGRRYLWYRVVARNELGRELGRGEIVHHINGDCTDDRPENLQVVTPREHGSPAAAVGHTRRVLPRVLRGQPVSCRLRYEQCCDEPACMKPARYGSLCPSHFRAATPARRAVELLGSDVLTEFRAGLDNWGRA